MNRRSFTGDLLRNMKESGTKPNHNVNQVFWYSLIDFDHIVLEPVIERDFV